MKFITFIKNLKTSLKSTTNPRFVIGNTSADYDSIFGSLIYAFFMTSALNVMYFPLIDCPAKDIPLRFEVNFILKKLKIDKNDLLFRESTIIPPNATFCLYDHNKRNQLEIHEIVDHHFYQKQHLPTNRYIIYPVGSALTILYFFFNPAQLKRVETKKQHYDNFYCHFQPFLGENFIEEKCKNPHQYDPVVNEIIRYGVLMDCYGFDQNLKQRWTDFDKHAIAKIQQSKSYDMCYEKLCEIKFDQNLALQLSAQNHLQKDYKRFYYNLDSKNLAKGKILAEYSVIFISPELLLKQYGEQLLAKFKKPVESAEKIVGHVYFLMFIFKQNGELQRQIIFYTESEQLKQKITKLLEQINFKRKDCLKQLCRWEDPTKRINRKKFDQFMSKL